MDGNDPTAPQAPLNPDLAGYPTVEALVHGYRESGNEAKKQRERADKLEQLATQLLASTGNPRGDVPDRGRGRSAEDRLTESAVPVDALSELIDRRIGNALEPITRGVSARGKIVADHPDYVKFENEVAQFIESDPEMSEKYPKLFSVDPASAMEYAFLKFGESRRRTHTPSQNGGRGPEDAAIPTSRSGDGRRQPEADLDVQAAFERYQKSGSSRDAAAYAKARLRTVIKDEFLNS